MSKIKNTKDVTMRGGKNVAIAVRASEKPPKADTTEPPSTETDPPGTPEKPTD